MTQTVDYESLAPVFTNVTAIQRVWSVWLQSRRSAPGPDRPAAIEAARPAPSEPARPEPARPKEELEVRPGPEPAGG